MLFVTQFWNVSLQYLTGNSPVTGEFPAQMATNAENVSIWWRHHDTIEPLESENHMWKVP